MMLRAARAAFVAAIVGFTTAVAADAASAKPADPLVLPAATRDAAAVVDAFHGALRRGDTAAASALLGEDVLIFEGGGVERSKAEYEAHHLAADAAFSRAVSSSVSRRAGHSNGAIAWIASEGRTSGVYKGKAVDRTTAETMILRQEGGQWKIVHVHWSSAAKP